MEKYEITTLISDALRFYLIQVDMGEEDTDDMAETVLEALNRSGLEIK